ncbi:MAG: FadR family transcriptional regulator [Lachnospiraceae bacterium]|nr:FadR family transcriptional regulator [Lachnospiraceae bacterium]
MKKIVRTNLTAQISSYIQDEIIKGTWKPGEKLPSETELAETLGVSRMSLRSAIQRCNAIGLTETHVGEGTFVRDFNLRSYFGELYQMKLLGKKPTEINDLRCVLQIASLRLALEKGIVPEDLEILESLGRQMDEAAASSNMDAFHEADAQFHRTICRLCKNEPLYIIYDALEFIIDDITRQNVERSVRSTPGFSLVLGHHHDMLESIRSRDINRFIKVQMESRERSYRYYSEVSAEEGHTP